MDQIENTLIDLDFIDEGSKEHEALLDSASLLYSKGGITNCLYLYPTIQVELAENFSFKAAYLTAWAKYGYDTDLDDRADAWFFGRELDWGFDYIFGEHVVSTLEFGYFWPGEIFREPEYLYDGEGEKYPTGRNNNPDTVFTAQGKLQIQF